MKTFYKSDALPTALALLICVEEYFTLGTTILILADKAFSGNIVAGPQCSCVSERE